MNANAKCQEMYATDLESIHSKYDFDAVIDTCGTIGLMVHHGMMNIGVVLLI